MTAGRVWVVRTGTANMASVLAALQRAGRAPRLVATAAELLSADPLVLPGVGAMGAAMATLAAQGWVAGLRARVEQNLPTLAICLGLQLLCRESEESPGVGGLGLIDAPVTRFPASVRVPQLGWNRVLPGPGCRVLEAGYAYFANSYRLVEPPAGWSSALAEHGGRFVAALERGRVLACQFHPELSGTFGKALLGRWLASGSSGGGSC